MHNDKPNIIQRGAVAHGWMRRSDLDKPNFIVWEKPNGELVATRSNTEPQIFTFSPSSTPWWKFHDEADDGPAE